MKKLSFLQLICIFFLGIGLTACATQSFSSDLAKKEHSLKLTNGKPVLPIRKAIDSEKEASITKFVSNSSYVVTAWLAEEKPVGRLKTHEKSTINNTDGSLTGASLEDLVAGFLLSFQVEKTLYSKSFVESSTTVQNDLRDFKIFVSLDEYAKERYAKGRKYLIFLEARPGQNELTQNYKLEKNTIYYRAFDGKTVSLFPWESGMHGSPTKGIVDLSVSEHDTLAERVEILCSALNEPNLKLRLQKLRELTNSEDKETRRNAIYALAKLETEK